MSVRDELGAIAEEHDGLLRAEDVVTFAKDPNTELHNRFEWDDTEAAVQYRLEQARRVIRIHVTVYENVREPVRAFVSLLPDRQEEGGGYRTIEDVMNDEHMRAQLLEQAMIDVRRWRKKYAVLKELREIFEAIERAEVVPA